MAFKICDVVPKSMVYRKSLVLFLGTQHTKMKRKLEAAKKSKRRRRRGLIRHLTYVFLVLHMYLTRASSASGSYLIPMLFIYSPRTYKAQSSRLFCCSFGFFFFKKNSTLHFCSRMHSSVSDCFPKSEDSSNCVIIVCF